MKGSTSATTIAVLAVTLDYQHNKTNLWVALAAEDNKQDLWIQAKCLPASVSDTSFPGWARSLVLTNPADVIQDFLRSKKKKKKRGARVQ